MKTLLANASGVLADTSIKLVPGRYAVQFKTATTSPAVLDQGTLTFSQRLAQPARILVAPAATAGRDPVALTASVDWALTAVTAGAAGNRIAIQTVSDINQPTAWLLEDQNPGYLFTLRYNPLDRIGLASDALEIDSDPYPREEITFLRTAPVLGFPAWKDSLGTMTIQVIPAAPGNTPLTGDLGGTVSRYQWAMVDGNDAYIHLTSPAPLDQLPPYPDLLDDQTWPPTQPASATVTNPVFTHLNPTGQAALELYQSDPRLTSILTIDPASSVASIAIAPLARTFLTGGADAVITEETVDIPVTIAPLTAGAAALTYTLATAAHRRGHFELIATEEASLLVSLTGGNNGGGLHLSVTPINP